MQKNQLSQNEKLAINFLNTSLMGKNDIETDYSSNYDTVVEELNAQAVLLLCISNKNTSLTKKQKDFLLRKTFPILANNVTIINEQKKIEKIFSDNHICAVTIKGLSAAYYYPFPQYRTLGDIDLLVSSEDEYVRAIELLTNNGYSLAGSIDFNKRNTTFITGKVEIELHRVYFTDNDVEEIDEFDKLLYNEFDNLIFHSVCGCPIQAFTDKYNGLILIHHLYKHFVGSGVGLRQLMDWKMFVEQVCDNDFWYNEFECLVEKIGLLEFTKAITLTCKKYLSMNTHISWCDDGADDSECLFIIRYIMKNGNFGNKTRKKQGEKIVDVMHGKYSVIYLIKRLQAEGIRDIKVCREHSMLRCFAWLIKLFTYIKEWLRSLKLHNRNVIDEFVDARQKKIMFEKLGI